MNLIYGNADELDITLVALEYKKFHVISIKPYKDGYRYSNCYVDINDKRIDKEEVKAYAGIGDSFDAEEFAAACVDYYGERFWQGSVSQINEDEAKTKIIKYLV